MNYYNENDHKAATWLRELMKDGLIPKGEVDERSICDVTASDVKAFKTCHWFAGIGGWALAFRLAGLPDDFEGDSCSCPCQPFSAAGQGKGEKDARDLWPEFFRIARERRAPVTFGEQVENAINKHGWLDRISADLEGCGYAVGAAVLPAACVGAPHIRHRLFWVADLHSNGRTARQVKPGVQRDLGCASKREQRTCDNGSARGMADGRSGERIRRGNADRSAPGLSLYTPNRSCVIGLGNGEGGRLGTDGRTSGSSGHPQQSGEALRGDSVQPGLERHPRDGGDRHESGRDAAQPDGPTAATGATGRLSNSAGSQLQGIAPAWNECGDGKNHFVLCRDTTPDGAPRIRRIPSEPAFFPLADGFSGSRVGLLRGAGNAIVPKAAAEFIQAWKEADLARRAAE